MSSFVCLTKIPQIHKQALGARGGGGRDERHVLRRNQKTERKELPAKRTGLHAAEHVTLLPCGPRTRIRTLLPGRSENSYPPGYAAFDLLTLRRPYGFLEEFE